MKKIALSLIAVIALAGIVFYFWNRLPVSAKTYNNSWISFNYPAILTTQAENDGSILVSHSVQYSHPNPCNEKDNEILDKLTDFQVHFENYPKDLKGTIMEVAPYLTQYVNGNNVQGTEDVKKVSAGSLNGYEFEIGAEGCGVHYYLFPLQNQRTLILARVFIPEFRFSGREEEYKKITGGILPEKEGEYFNQILDSIKLK